MKGLKEVITESKTTEFSVAFNDFVDDNGMPIACKVLVDSKYADKFEKFGADQEGEIFARFEGNKVTY